MNKRSFKVSSYCRQKEASGNSYWNSFVFDLSNSEEPSWDVFWKLIYEKGYWHIHKIIWVELPSLEEQLSS